VSTKFGPLWQFGIIINKRMDAFTSQSFRAVLEKQIVREKFAPFVASLLALPTKARILC
jgi:hypothetical protein